MHVHMCVSSYHTEHSNKDSKKKLPIVVAPQGEKWEGEVSGMEAS